MNKILRGVSVNIESWTKRYHYRLMLLNIILIVLFLLHSVGYFHPYFPISINFIILITLILSAFLLNARSKVFFIAALFFWIIAMFFKLVRVDVWAERTGDYVFQMLLLGVIILFWEQISPSVKKLQVFKRIKFLN